MVINLSWQIETFMNHLRFLQLVIRIGPILLFMVGCSVSATSTPIPLTPLRSSSLPTATPITLGTTFILPYNGSVAVSLENSQALKIQFLSLLEDSRCPSDVLCAWAGNVTVVIRVWAPGSRSKDFLLSSNSGIPRYVDHLQYRITLFTVNSTVELKSNSDLPPYETYSLELIVGERAP